MVNVFRKASIANVLIKRIKQRNDIKYFQLQLEIINNDAYLEALKYNIKTVQDKYTNEQNMEDYMINLNEIIKAKQTINKIIEKTPFVKAIALSDKIGANIFLKKKIYN